MSRKRRSRNPTSVVLYGRVSTEEQCGSLVGQLDELRRYVLVQELTVECEFVDQGESGRDDQRPRFQAMLEHVCSEESSASQVLVVQGSRFMRDAGKARLVKAQLGRHGVRVVATQHPTGDDATGKLIEQIFESIAEWESRENGRRTSNGLRSAAMRGSFPGSRPPFGYRVEVTNAMPRAERRLVIASDEAGQIEEIFMLYGGGRGAVHIAATLNARGLRCRGRLWDRDRVLRVLGDETVSGHYVWGRSSADRAVAIEVDPIVARSLFETVQRERIRRDPLKNPGRASSSSLLLGGGLLRCGLCGESCELETAGKRKANGDCHRYYQCSRARRAGRATCPGVSVAVDALDAAVVERVVETVFSPERCARILTEFVSPSGPLSKRISTGQATRERELRDLVRRRAKLVEVIETADKPPAFTLRRVAELETSIALIERSLAQAPTSVPNPDDAVFVARFAELAREHLRHQEDLLRAFLRSTGDQLVLHADRSVSIVAAADPMRSVS